ncbi:TIGR01620 family protein [Shewanella corallii]|uniref:TIGR01620 family protein n=1 Tax=Shewanella corallii TaxID=560080 RepID=A0ABT0NBH0_9GAMM|nr:TIGR01620 family protein [Shewanella corallii]MCL2915808.1 TIGR01620 family protein [Shewanella corallii]
MSEDKQNSPSSFKPRQVFDSSATEINSPEKDTLLPAREYRAELLEPEEATEQLTEESAQRLSAEPIPGRPRISGLGKLLLASLGLLLGVEMVLTLEAAWNNSPWLFSLYAGVGGIATAWLGRGLWREYRLLRRLKLSEQNRLAAERLSQSMQQGETERFIEQVCAHLPASTELERFYQSRREDQNDAEQLLLFDELVLSPVDKRARAVVRKYAGESALLLAASPLAVLDMALIMWRNQKMIREVAACYGIELGYWSRVKLVKGIISNILYAGATEVALDLGSQLLSMEVTGKLSARLAQGLGGGLLTARLGYQAMALCRPLTFNEASRPRLGQMHRELLSELKSFSASVLNSEKPKESAGRNK